ncbi:MAG: hypothetical protein WC344_02470 [Bacilli bacterium]|jgi:hypothetical protein
MNENDNNSNPSVESQDEAVKLSKKSRLISYLPALIIAIITMVSLLFIIIGTIGGQDGNAQTRLLHRIDFTGEVASFDENYSYRPAAAEVPEFVVEQGLKWGALDSKMRVECPSYNTALQLDIDFGDFNVKVFPILETDDNDYVIEAFNTADQLLVSKHLNDVHEADEKSVELAVENAAYLHITFLSQISNPSGEGSGGFLYLQKMALSEKTYQL